MNPAAVNSLSLPATCRLFAALRCTVPLMFVLMFLLLSSHTSSADELTVVRYTNLWTESPARIADAAAVTWLPKRGHLLISDSEISEYGSMTDPQTGQPVFQGSNLFEVSLDAQQVFGRWMIVPPETSASEPVGLAWHPEQERLFVSNDDQRRLYCYQLPAEGKLIAVSSISTNAGDDDYSDPEGLACDPTTGAIWVVSGTQRERVIRFRFDQSTRQFAYTSEFSLDGHIRDPEGIAIHPPSGDLFLISSRSIARFTADGRFLQSFPCGQISGWRSDFRLPGGATFAPSSAPDDDADTLSLYVTCRGIDNGQFPQKNSLDGGLVELRLTPAAQGSGDASP